MIPKIIHYCWFGGAAMPKLAQKCIKSWKRYCPDYRIIEWNEDNIDLSKCPLYVQQAYHAKKWAFVSDYVRLKVVYDMGGIYLDTDVELKVNLDSLLQYAGYFGFERGTYINTGLGFGAVAKLGLLKELMDDYENISFIMEDGSVDSTTCPYRNIHVFIKHGLKQDDTMQLLDGNICIFPTEYLCPIDYDSGLRMRSKNIISIHWFSSSWKSQNDKRNRMKNLPNKCLFWLLGKKRYETLKSKLTRR